MGHDIYSYDTYSYDSNNEIAYLRRSASDPLNQVIYIALGVMEEAYSGCSGRGESINFSLNQLETAKEILDKQDFSQLTRESNVVDYLLDAMKRLGAEIIQPEIKYNITQEKEFIDKCINHLKLTSKENITIVFS